MTGSLISFHVIYMPGTVERLAPFAFTLLDAENTRFVLVDNVCGANERACLERVAHSEPRFDYLRLPGERPMTHGDAIGHLLSRSRDRWFGILDSDVLASGDFMTDLVPHLDDCAGVFSAPAVWRLPALAQTPDHAPFLGGSSDTLRDGTPIGLTHTGIYDRALLQTAIDALPHGLRKGSWSDLIPTSMRRELKRRNWHYRRFGTARVVHLRLLLDGHRLKNIPSSHLHHIGGLSHRHDQLEVPFGTRLRRFTDRMTHGPNPSWLNLLSNVPHLLENLSPLEREQQVVRQTVTDAITRLLDALATGEPAPPVIHTGIAEVDAGFDRLRRALIEQYPQACARLRAVIAEPHRKVSVQ